MNSISLVGRAGSDPEVRYLDSGKVVAKLPLAVRRAYSRGEVDTDWFSLEIWGKTAEVAANYVRKGSQISVTGRLEFDSWEKDGQRREKAIVKVNDLGLLDSKQSQQEQPSPQPQYQQQQYQQSQSQSPTQYQQQPPQYQQPQHQQQPQYRNDEF